MIASAAASGDKVAIKLLDEALFDLGAAVHRIASDAEHQNELRQRVRVRLFVAKNREVPRIAKYSGRGPLRAWLRVTATRVALDMRRADKPRSSDAELADLWSADPDPELSLLKTQYRAEFRAALSESLASLPDRERAVLRLHFVESLRLAEIAKLYDVHESTVSRWIKSASSAVMDGARRRLTSELSLSNTSFESLARALRSQLDLSINALLG